MFHNRLTADRSSVVLHATLAAVVLAAGFSSRVTAAENGELPPVFPYKIHRTVLDNGLTILSVPFDSPGTFSYYTIVRTGSRNEVEEGLSGFAHFFEHMMFRGTPTYSTEAYNEKLKEFGVDSNAFTTDDWTCYHLTASVAALPVVIELEADRFQHLSYDRAGFQKEARAVLGEYNKIASSPMLPLEEKLQDLAYDTHTYEHTTIGFLKDIVDMPNQYEYSLKFFERWYRPDNCIVLVVGDVDHEGVVQLARRHYAGWKPGVAKIDIPGEPPQQQERRAHLPWNGATLPYLYIGYHVPEFDPHSKDIAALDVLAEAYFSATSPLYRKLVLEEGKADAIMAGAAFRRDPSLFTILVRLRDAKDFDLVEGEIYRTLEEAAKQPLDAARLEAIKSHLRYSFAPDTTDEVARILGTYLQLTGDAQSLNQMYATYARVTTEDVQRVAGKYFSRSNRTVVTLSSEEKAAGISHPLVPTLRVGTDDPTLRVPAPAKESAMSGIAKRRDAERPDQRSHAERGSEAFQLAAYRRLANDKKDSSALVVLHLPTDSTHVALRFTVRAGSQCDPPGKAGLAALTSRLLSEGGSKDLTYQELLLALYPMAGSMDSRCDKEQTLFAGKIHREKLAEFIDLFAATLLEPRFDPDDFERLKREQISYLAASLRGNNDEELGKQTLQLMLYPPSHPYGHVEEGTVSDLESITLEDVKQFYRTWYTPENCLLGVAGDVSSEFLDKLTRQFAEKLTPGETTPPELPRPAVLNDLEVTIIQKPNIATAISIGMPLDMTRADDDFYPLMVANSAFGEHRTFNGRLMRNMRGKRGLNYGDYSYIENFIEDSGSRFPVPNIPRRQQFFSIWIRPVPHDKGVFALRQAVRELELLVRDGLTEEEFETTRNFLFNYSKLWVQDQSRRLGYQMDGRFYDRQSVVEELNRRLPTMTREQVNEAIKKHLRHQNLAVAVVTQEAEAFRDKLLSGEPTPLVYDTEGTPADVLAEDKIIQSYKLDVNADRLKIVPVEEMFK